MKPKPDEMKMRAIGRTLLDFSFEKVHAAVTAMRWTLNTSPAQQGNIPTIEEMKAIARDLLEKAWDDEDAPNCEYSHGGLRASRVNTCLTLQFVIEESYFVGAIDACEDQPSG